MRKYDGKQSHLKPKFGLNHAENAEENYRSMATPTRNEKNEEKRMMIQK